jgi:hypothetical protein
MKISKYVRVHQDVVIEWVYDSELYLDNDYGILVDNTNNTKTFTFLAPNDTDAVIKEKQYNNITNQLYSVDSVLNRWKLADTAKVPGLQLHKHLNPALARFDTVKIHFPLNYNFKEFRGFYLGIYAYNQNNTEVYYLANYFFDIEQIRDDLKLSSNPDMQYEMVWGKYIELNVPSIYEEAKNRQVSPSIPTPGTINFNFGGSDTSGGFSSTSPIFVDFRFIDDKITLLNEPIYISTEARAVSFPQTSEHQNLGVKIESASDGDYFKIYGTFANSLGEFGIFMNNLELQGQKNYILYIIDVFEEGIPTQRVQYYVHDDFDKIIEYRPILKHTNTAADIEVTMKVVDTVDNSVITRKADYGMLSSEVLKHGVNRLAININNAYKPKIYNAKADQVIVSPIIASNSRRTQTQKIHEIKFKEVVKTEVVKEIQTVNKPYPMLIAQHNVVVKDLNASSNGDTYFGQGQLVISLTPFDNIVKIKISKEVSTNAAIPLDLNYSYDTRLEMTFTGNGNTVSIPLFAESDELSLQNGIVIFLIKASDISIIERISTSTDIFYITMTSNGNTTVVYRGKFVLSHLIGNKIVEEPVKQVTPIEPLKPIKEVIAPPVIVPPLPEPPVKEIKRTSGGGGGDHLKIMDNGFHERYFHMIN